MKPIEIKFINADSHFESGCKMVIYYDDNTQKEYYFNELPSGFKLNRHYSITDLYGYGVIDGKGE